MQHTTILTEALYYPDSPANGVSVTKLGLDTLDTKSNILIFSLYSIFIWNHNLCTTYLYYSRVNLLELLILLLLNPLACLATYFISSAFFITQLNLKATLNRPKASSINLLKNDILNLFKLVPKLDFYQLLNTLTLTDLEKNINTIITI